MVLKSMKKINVLFFIFTIALVKPVWASTLDGKALHCLTEKEHLREVHLVGQRFFAFKDGGILEIIVTKDVPPKVQRTNTFPVESSVETLKFENHFLFRKTLRLLSPTSVFYQCEVFHNGMTGLSPRITAVFEKYKKRIGENKL